MSRRALSLVFAVPILLAILPPKAQAEVLAIIPQSLEVKVIDTATDTVVEQIPISFWGFGVAVSPASQRFYVWGQVIGTSETVVEVFDANDFSSIGFFSMGSNFIRFIAPSPDGSRFYMGLVTDAIWVMRTSNNSFITSIRGAEIDGPDGLAFLPDGSRFFTTNGFSGITMSAIIDPSTNTILGGLSDTGRSSGIAIDPSGTTAYYARNSPEVTIVDIATETVIDRIPLGDRSRKLALSPNGTELYVTTSNNELLFIDIATKTILASPLSGALPEEIGVHPDGSRVYVLNLGSNFVSVFDTTTRERSHQITVGGVMFFNGSFLGDFTPPPPDILIDGFESGDTSSWSATVGSP
ncbi:MAG: YncE family protein [Acidobacteria bacterium]|nr:YncE family protein [Acidobacteriota bacterium]